MKKLCLIISGAVSFVIFLILFFITGHMSGEQLEQQMAERWSEKKDVAQVSCFFSVSAEVTQDSIEEFEHTLDKALADASVTASSQDASEERNPGARLWADAYSADGKITLTSDRATLEANAIGIGGDFFLFHPLQLVSGSYFSGNDLMQDYCVIDEDAAWQLFGSSDVAGMMVTINKVPHIVTGVIKRPEGRLEDAAGLSGTVVYVSYQTLEQYGRCYGINHYEIVMPNPVSNFALNHVKENIGVDEKNMEIVENNSRYGLLSRLKTIGAFGTRSMNGKAIIYPYWENIARGYEDIIALITIFMLLFLLYPVVLLVIFFIVWWKHKGWTLKDVWHGAKDKWERFLEKRRENRRVRGSSSKDGLHDSGRKRRKGRKKDKLYAPDEDDFI